MKNSKLKELFWGFSEKNFKRARDFLNSPYFNKNPNFVTLLDFIESRRKSEFPFSEEVISYIETNHLCEKTHLRIFLSQFTKLIQLFLETEELRSKPILRSTYLLNVFNRINAQKSFSMLLNEVKKQQENTYTKDEDFYYNQMYIELEELNNKMMKDNYELSDNIKKVSLNLDYFFILSKLNLLHFVYHYKQDLSSFYNAEIWLQKEMEKFLKKEYESLRTHHPIIYSKYLILLTIAHPDKTANYFKLREFVIENSSKINTDILEYIFTALMNYAIIKVNIGEDGFSKEIVELFYLMENFNIITNESPIDYIIFINIITTFLSRNNIEKADEFFNKYNMNILPLFREDASNLSKAAIEFHKGNKDNAISLLNNLNYKNYYFYLRAKALLCKILFDSGEFESIQYLCDATKHYLKRNRPKISETLYRLYDNFFLYMEKISRMKLGPDSVQNQKKTNLLASIKKEKFVASKAWLIEKLKAV